MMSSPIILYHSTTNLLQEKSGYRLLQLLLQLKLLVLVYMSLQCSKSYYQENRYNRNKYLQLRQMDRFIEHFDSLLKTRTIVSNHLFVSLRFLICRYMLQLNEALKDETINMMPLKPSFLEFIQFFIHNSKFLLFYLLKRQLLKVF